MTETTAPRTIRRTIIDGIYEVASKSFPGHYYTVDVRHHTAPTCTCMAGQGNFENCKNVTYCWHVREAMALDLPLWIERTRRESARVIRETEALIAVANADSATDVA